MPPKPLDIAEVFFDIIGALYDNSDTGLTQEELCESCRLPRTSLEPILRRLEQSDWIRRDSDTGSFRIGMYLLCFADKERLNAELARQIAPTMRQLSQKCRQTVEMNVIEGTYSVCLYKVEPRDAIRIASRIGRQSPLHAGASGKVLLAFANETIQKSVLSQPMEKYSPHTITDPSKMLQELSRIRALGYATSIEEYDPGAAAVSAPILNNKRDIIAEISVIGTRFSYEQEHRFWLRELVEAISTIPTRRTQDSEDTIAPDA